MFKLRRWSQTTNNGKTVNKMSIHHEAHEGHEDKANQKNINYFINFVLFVSFVVKICFKVKHP